MPLPLLHATNPSTDKVNIRFRKNSNSRFFFISVTPASIDRVSNVHTYMPRETCGQFGVIRSQRTRFSKPIDEVTHTDSLPHGCVTAIPIGRTALSWFGVPELTRPAIPVASQVVVCRCQVLGVAVKSTPRKSTKMNLSPFIRHVLLIGTSIRQAGRNDNASITYWFVNNRIVFRFSALAGGTLREHLFGH